MKKFFLVAVIALSQFSLHAQTKTITGFTDQSASQQFSLEQNFDKNLSAENIGNTIKELSSRPHNLGSAGDKLVAENIYNRFKSYGFDVRIDTYHVLFPTPKTRVLEMIAPTTYNALLKEPVLKEDATSGQADQLPTYNAFSADGDVTGELIFVNYGLPEDYELLARMDIDVRGKIVIAKYGRSWRGIKPKVAQEHGALGCIIYSDPKDDGYYEGEVYPKGAFKNEFGVQRGSVMDMPIYPGDPLTPGVGATTNAQRISSHNDAPNLLKIPVLPISYHDAKPLLESLEGPVAPDDWRGALPFTYHVGPGKTKVHLKLEFNWNIVPCYDVIATIKGSQYPDEWVIRGNHHDAWVNGADDPISGQAALLEEAKSIGELVKTGWKPKRTIVYCAWDGEEPALLGSTEWAEAHDAELQQHAVVYINSDGNGRGFLQAEGSHTLEHFINDVARDIDDPETHLTVWKRKQAKAIDEAKPQDKEKVRSRADWRIGALGSGSDFTPFLQHLGVPTLNIGYGGEDESGIYHSIYDDFYFYTHFLDTDFAYGRTLAQTGGTAVIRLADADILPFQYANLADTVRLYEKELRELLKKKQDEVRERNREIADGVFAGVNEPKRPQVVPKAEAMPPALDLQPISHAI